MHTNQAKLPECPIHDMQAKLVALFCISAKVHASDSNLWLSLFDNHMAKLTTYSALQFEQLSAKEQSNELKSMCGTELHINVTVTKKMEHTNVNIVLMSKL